MPAFAWSELPTEVLDPEHSRATGAVFPGEKIAVRRMHVSAGTVVKPHASRREQVHSVLAGRARYRVGDAEAVVGPGRPSSSAPHTEQSIEVLEDMELIGFQDVAPLPNRSPAPAAGASDLITPKYSSGRGPTITGERIEVAFIFYPAGTEGQPHAHPNEQIQVALRGRVRGCIAGVEHVIEPGRGILFPPNVEHGVQILEDYTVINCKDIVPGWSTYHARWER